MGPNPIGLLSLLEEGTQTQRSTEGNHVKTQGEGGRLHAKERGPQRKPTLLTP